MLHKVAGALTGSRSDRSFLLDTQITQQARSFLLDTQVTQQAALQPAESSASESAESAELCAKSIATIPRCIDTTPFSANLCE